MKSLAASIPTVALTPWLVVAAWRHGRKHWRAIAGAVALFVAVSTPFYIIGAARFGARFWNEHFGYSLLARARGDLAVGDDGGLLFYGRYLFEIDGISVGVWIGVATIGALVVAARHRDRDLGIVGGYALFLLVALSLIGTRLPPSLLPLYPAAALAAAGLYARLARRIPILTATPIYTALPLVIALAIFLTGITNSDPRAHLLPAPTAPEVGRAAARATTPGEPVYAYGHYATAFAYYADRPLKIATPSSHFFAIVDDVDFFHAAGVAVRVPPPPAPPGRSMVIYAPAGLIANTPWLAVEKVLHEADPLVLVRARVVDSSR
jgi:hypothetical protein